MVDGRNQHPTGPQVDAIDDAVFVALRNRHRRYALYYLLEHASVSTAELADAVTGWTHLESGMATRGDREAVYVSLVHQHLPLLEDVGLIDRDAEGRVTRTDWPDPVPAFVRRALAQETGARSA